MYINLLKGISPSDTEMKALKPVSSCNPRVGNPPEFQPPLSLSALEMSDSSRRSGGSIPVVGKTQRRMVYTIETTRQKGLTQLFFSEAMDGLKVIHLKKSVAEQKSTWWMLIEEAGADIGCCPSHLFVITFPSDTVSCHGKLKTAQPWQRSVAHGSAERQ